MTIFLNSFGSLFQSVMMIFLIAFVAGMMVRKKLLNSSHIKGLSIVTINILLPSLIFSKISENLQPSELPIWWIIPLIAMATTGIGFSLAWFVWRKHLPAKRNLLPLSALMNAAYFTLPVGMVIYPSELLTVEESKRVLNNTNTEYSFEFEGVGFIVRGRSEITEQNNNTDILDPEIVVFVDDVLIEKTILPTDFTKRRNEICWKYNLKEEKHNVRIELVNPSESNQIILGNILIYINKL